MCKKIFCQYIMIHLLSELYFYHPQDLTPTISTHTSLLSCSEDDESRDTQSCWSGELCSLLLRQNQQLTHGSKA